MNETLKTIYSLCSIHGNFDLTREISDDDLKTILNASVRAATASARQTYSVIIVDDQDDMKKYLQYTGSKALIFCADFNWLKATADTFNYEFDCGGVVDFITGSADTFLAAQTAAIAAKSLGIDSLFTNSIHRGDLDAFYQKFNLPSRYCFPLIALILGYTAAPKHQLRGRLNGTEIFHPQKYHPISQHDIRRIAAAFDDPAQNLGLRFNPTREHPRYMDWFFKVWCQPENKEVHKQKRLEVEECLRKTGFLEEL